jgi:hypothetical protein
MIAPIITMLNGGRLSRAGNNRCHVLRLYRPNRERRNLQRQGPQISASLKSAEAVGNLCKRFPSLQYHNSYLVFL